MRLYELNEIDPNISKLIVAVDQLRTRLEKNPGIQWSIEDLFRYLERYDITLDITDLYDMVQRPPLNKVISNIQRDEVIFKDQDSDVPETDLEDTDSKKIVSKMAKKANDLK